MRIKATAKYPWPKLTDRLNHRPVSRVEALRQLQIMMPLSASALHELRQCNCESWAESEGGGQFDPNRPPDAVFPDDDRDPG
jgi:hypothetical protein